MKKNASVSYTPLFRWWRRLAALRRGLGGHHL